MDDREFRLRLQREAYHSRQRTREVIAQSGHPNAGEITREFDRKMWEVETGVYQARMAWGSLSETQRRVMIALGEGRALSRQKTMPSTYDAVGIGHSGIDAISSICRTPTVKYLVRRDMIEADGPTDQMKRLVLTNRGRLTLKMAEDPNRREAD